MLQKSVSYKRPQETFGKLMKNIDFRKFIYVILVLHHQVLCLDSINTHL